MHQIVCRLGLPPDPTGCLQRPPDPLAGLRGGAPGERNEGGEGERREGGERRGGEGWSPGMPKSRVGRPRSEANRISLGLGLVGLMCIVL